MELDENSLIIFVCDFFYLQLKALKTPLAWCLIVRLALLAVSTLCLENIVGRFDPSFYFNNCLKNFND